MNTVASHAQTSTPTEQLTFDPEAKPFWEGLREGKLFFQRCLACQAPRLPARSECPRCLSPEAVWEQSSGYGKLVSWVVYHTSFNPKFERPLPYVVAFIELREGARLVANVVGGEDPESLVIDQPMKLTAHNFQGNPVPAFVPATSD